MPLSELVINKVSEVAQRDIARQRGLLSAMGLDRKRPKAWEEYGYQETLTFNDFYRLYKRQGIAYGVVNQLIDKCWSAPPAVIQGTDDDDDRGDETPWEKRVKRVLRDSGFWRAFQEADKRRLVGGYAGIILQVADNQQWSQPIGRGAVVKYIPAWAGELKVGAYDTDIRSATVGQVKHYTYNQADIPDVDTVTALPALEIHPSRVIILGDIRENESLLEAAYNDFVGLEKVLGGGPESFLKNASRQLSVNFDKEADLAAIAAAHGVPMTELHEVFNNVAKDINRGIDSLMITQAANVTPLTSNMPDPSKPFDIALQSVCASVRLPAKIVIGNQTGERSSTEDQKQFNARAQGRRIHELTPDIMAAIRHLLQYKLLDAAPVADLTLVWDDLNEASQSEKLAAAKDMAEVNSKMLGTGELVFSIDEIRNQAGWDSKADAGLEDETLPELDNNQEEEDDGASAASTNQP